MSSLTAKKIAVRFRKNTFRASKKAPGCPQKAPGHTYGYEHRSQTHMIKATRCFAPLKDDTNENNPLAPPPYFSRGTQGIKTGIFFIQ